MNTAYCLNKCLLVFIFFCLTQNEIRAQLEDHPRLGLVLSGGAAHGLAHIGVLKYLEEKGIKPDYITGTSMGAVIGGLYAIGYSADQIEALAASQDWEGILSNNIPLYNVAPVEKKAHERIPLTLKWQNKGFDLPPAIISGQKLDIELSNLFIPAYNERNFDELSIPFRCVAINLQDGSIDVFKEGYIADAIRASMSIPSVFPPKELNDKLYVDGGLIRNFPVEEAKEMGADIIIGVYVGGVKMDKNKLVSIFDIMEQTAFMSGILDSEEQAKAVDVLITPKVKRMGKFAFEDYKIFVQKGYEAASQYSAELTMLSDSIARRRSTVHDKALKAPDSLYIDFLEIPGVPKAMERLIRNKLDNIHEGNISVKDLEQELSLIFGTKNFDKTNYSFVEKENKLGLRILTEKANPYTLGVSFNRFRRYGTSMILNTSARNILGGLSNFSLDARISDFPGIQSKYYIRFPSQPTWLLSLYGKYESYELPFINNDVLDRLYAYRDGIFSGELNKEWRNSYIFSMGYAYEYDRIRPEVVKADDFVKYQSSRQRAYFELEFNDLDRQVYPRRGLSYFFSSSFIFDNTVKREDVEASKDFLNINEDASYWRWDLSAEYYYSLSSNVVLELQMAGRASTGRSLLDSYKIGGPFQSKDFVSGFIGLEESEFLVGDHLSLKSALRMHYNDLISISPTLHFMRGIDYLHFAYNRERVVSILGLGIQFGLDTPIGPISFDVGYTNQTEELNLNFGVGFRHIY